MKVRSAYLFVITAAIIWGATPAIMKITLAQIPLFSLAFLRMFFAANLLYFFTRNDLKIQKKNLVMFICLAVTGVTIHIAFFFFGLRLTQAIHTAFLVASAPILAIVAAHFYLREKFEKKLILSGLVAILGIGIIVGKPTNHLNPTEVIGDILILISSLAWVIHELIAKKLLKTYKSTTVTFYTLFIGSITFLPFYLFELVNNPGWIFNVNTTGFLGLAFGIFLASFAAYLAWQKGLSKLPVGQASFFFYLDPISGSIFSILLLGEKLTPPLIVGGALITLAVILAEYRRKQHPLHKKFS